MDSFATQLDGFKDVLNQSTLSINYDSKHPMQMQILPQHWH